MPGRVIARGPEKSAKKPPSGNPCCLRASGVFLTSGEAQLPLCGSIGELRKHRASWRWTPSAEETQCKIRCWPELVSLLLARWRCRAPLLSQFQTSSAARAAMVAIVERWLTPAPVVTRRPAAAEPLRRGAVVTFPSAAAGPRRQGPVVLAPREAVGREPAERRQREAGGPAPREPAVGLPRAAVVPAPWGPAGEWAGPLVRPATFGAA